MLQILRDEVGDEWPYGAQLIPESDFEDYARDLAEDCGAFPVDGLQWPYTCINWEWAARELSHDYSLITFDGDDYYVRL